MKHKFCLKDIHTAYKKFKSYIYYDNFNLHLRYKISEFESANLDEKLEDLCNNLNKFCKNEATDFFDNYIKESGYIILPKTFKSSDDINKKQGETDAYLLTNKNSSSFDVSKITILYDAPIELFIIATIWTIKISKYLNISPDNYGYVVPSAQNSKLLFEPYFKKYQEWRDKGISAAKQQIERGNNVLIITLDIKNYFHSVQVDFNSLRNNIPEEDTITTRLTNIIESICWDHTIKIYKNSKTKPILPIGLPSSGIIANWILSKFDKDIKNSTAPVYYGRYVDDMFLVLANIEPDPNYTSVTEWLCERFFNNKKVLEKKQNVLILKSERCENLEIQTEKLRLFYFDAHWSLAVLNKFQSTIQENSSAFWFLPNEENLKTSLDDTYDLQYEDTINKFRSVSSCKINKYEASVFLAKRLKLAILSPGKYDKNLSEDIFRFFNGTSIVSMYSMWEKVFTYFSITHDFKSICRLQNLINNGIEEIKTDKIEENTIDNVNQKLQKHLKEHLLKCLMLAKVFVKDNIGTKESQQEIRKGATIFKKALMTRHFYLPLPIYALTEEFINQDINISDFNISFIESKNDIPESILEKSWLIPRNIPLHEICTLKIPHLLSGKDAAFYTKSNKNNVKNLFITQCLSLFNKLNNENLHKLIRNKKHKRYIETINNSKKLRIYSEIIHVNTNSIKNKIKIGVSNVNTDLNDIENAILHRSSLNTEKRKRHIDILNQAEKIQTDILLLPEVFVPFDWLCAYADESRRKQRAMIFGLEHFSLNNICYNLAITLLPFEYHNRKEVLIIPRNKNHYSPSEIMTIEGNRKSIPENKISTYHLFQWNGIQFSVYNCFELTDIVDRSIFRSELDILFAIEYNKDINYFSNISESVSRDLHCYYIQANTSDYGDSRIVEPKKRDYQNPVRVKGGNNDVILNYELDIAALRKFQNQTYTLQNTHEKFKKTPPNFQHEKVNKRGNFDNQ
jgi:hypothetical protein